MALPLKESIRLRLRNWLIGYKVEGVAIEVFLVGYDEFIGKLETIEMHLDKIASKCEQVEKSLVRLSK